METATSGAVERRTETYVDVTWLSLYLGDLGDRHLSPEEEDDLAGVIADGAAWAVQLHLGRDTDVSVMDMASIEVHVEDVVDDEEVAS
jgi:hypothetical protein